MLLGTILLTVLGQGYHLYKRLADKQFELTSEQVRVNIWIVFLSIFIVLVFKEKATEFITNILLGITFLILAFRLSIAFLGRKDCLVFRIIDGFEMVSAFLLGLFCLFTQYHAVRGGMYALGILLISDSLYRGFRIYVRENFFNE